jgi:hypothetical protein
MKRAVFMLALLLGVAFPSRALPQVEANPNNEYPVTPEAGEWFFCATSYVGPQAQQLAHEMVLEIRSRFKMPAYVLNRGEEERRKRQQELEQLKKEYPYAEIPRRVGPRIHDQCAVLVGGFKDQETASHALKEFKKLPRPSNDRLCPVLTQQVPAQKAGQAGSELQYVYVNPFPNAFVVRNPTIPREPKNKDKNDPFLKRLNSGEAYSLLKCKKQYTLMIAVFRGLQTFQSASDPNEGFFEKLFGSGSGDRLAASGQNAHNLAALLRGKPWYFEAYVLHMREMSAVTIGGFDGPDDPQVKVFEQALATRLKYNEGQLQLLPQPLLIEVPRP